MRRSPRAADFFGERVEWYDRYYDARDADGHMLRTRMATVLRRAGDGPGDALDAGMGPGRLCAALADHGWTVSGVDASAEMVDAARTRLPDARDRLLVAPIEALPFAERTFDLVTATGVLEYAAVPAALAEIARVLRPGGRAVVSYPNPRAVFGMWKTRAWYPAVRAGKRVLRRPHPEMPRGAGELLPHEFTRLLAAAGLEPVSQEYTSYVPSVTPVELLAPRAVAALATRVEGARRGARALATQVVYAARRPEGGAQEEDHVSDEKGSTR